MTTSGNIRRAKQKAVGGKKDRCRKGKSCSATCISGWKVCLVDLSSSVTTSLGKIKGFFAKGERGDRRSETFDKVVFKKLKDRVREVADSGDSKELKKLLKMFPKVSETARRLGSKADVEGLRKSLIRDWKNARFENAKDIVRNRLVASIAAEDRDRYEKLKAQLTRLEGPSRRGEMWDNYQGLAQFSSRLNKTSILDVREGVRNLMMSPSAGKTFQMLQITSNVLGNKVEIAVTPNSLSFLVNGSYTASGKLPPVERIAVAREVKRQFTEVLKSIGEGVTLSVIAADGDGKEGMRIRSYQKSGFSPPDEEGFMYGIVRNGKVTPITRGEFKDAARFKV